MEESCPLLSGPTSSFLLRRDAGGQWRIVVYLNHQDIVGMIRGRAATASG